MPRLRFVDFPHGETEFELPDFRDFAERVVSVEMVGGQSWHYRVWILTYLGSPA